MASSTTGDRRWGTTRRSGMTILGKVAVPKPINLPSQRLENQGLDPNVEIVPKGTLSWGSKSSVNAWGASSLSPRTDSGTGSPSHLSNRPSSGGTVTRPSTAGSDKAHESSAWDSNSRPSSASGVLPSNQGSIALTRPHSAETRPGSSQLSRFAEPVPENSAAWGHNAEKLGVAPTKNDGFSLTSGDFPSLGAEKESSGKSKGPQDSGPHARPVSSSGRSMEERGVDFTEEHNVRTGDVNTWRRDNQSYGEDGGRYGRGEGQMDARGSQAFHNTNFPHNIDTWRGPPVNNHQGGWYRGNHPYGAPMGPGGFQMDPFQFYPTQVPPVPGHGAGPRGNHANNGKMFRPPMLDSYVHPRMATRPGFYMGPVPCEGYYGPPMGYGGPNNRDLPFAGRPAGPHNYNKHYGQGGYDMPGSSVTLDQTEPSHSQETQRAYKVLLKPQDGGFGEDGAKREELLANRLPSAERIAQQRQTSKTNWAEDSIEACGVVQSIKEESAPGDPSLIQKIEGLNAKTRTHDGWQNASSVSTRDEQESKSRADNSGSSVNKVSARIPRTDHASDSKNLEHHRQGNPATNKNTELAAVAGTATSRRSTQPTQGRADNQSKRKVNNEGSDGWRKTTIMSGSHTTSAANSESSVKVNAGDSLDTGSNGNPGYNPLGKLKGESGISTDPNDNQRSTMRELARQRAQQRQKEEEERAREQRAKALAKLEELNRRSQVPEEVSVKNLEAASNAYVPNMTENPRSHSPSLEMKTTIAAAKSEEPTGESRMSTMQDAMTSAGYENNMGSTVPDNVPRDHDGTSSKNKRLGYKQKQNFVYEKKVPGNSLYVATTEVCEAVPSPEAANEDALIHSSDTPATSSVATESTLMKRKNNRNGKKKPKVDETTTMNTSRAAVGKETKLGDESIETGRSRAVEMVFGSVSVPILDTKVSGNSSEPISSFTNEESQSRAKKPWKAQHSRKTQRNSQVNKPVEKSHVTDAVVWAPVHPQQKADMTPGVGPQNTVPEHVTSSKSLHQGQTSSKGKRVEIERYVPKPIVKEMAEQSVGKNDTITPEVTANVSQRKNSAFEGTRNLQTSGSTVAKAGSPSKSRQGSGRQGKHGSWHQRSSAEYTKVSDEGESVISNQPIRERRRPTEQNDIGSVKEQIIRNDDGWNDGWFMTPETQHPATYEVEATAPQAASVGKDRGLNIHGSKQHASRSNKDGGNNYGDPKKTNRGRGLSQPDLLSHGSGDQVSHAPVVSNNRTGKYGGRENTRDESYGSHRKDGAGDDHQVPTHVQSQPRSINKEVQMEQNPSGFQKNTSQNRRYGRGHEPQGGWGLSTQENTHHQRPQSSNRDRQKQYSHYEYKPVGSHTNEGERNREQPKESSQSGGPRYREKGPGLGHQRQTGGAGKNGGGHD